MEFASPCSSRATWHRSPGSWGSTGPRRPTRTRSSQAQRISSNVGLHGADTLVLDGLCKYNNIVSIIYDPAKRAKAIAERQLDFEDAKFVFESTNFETVDTRKDYGEQRILCYGMLRDRMVVFGYTPRGADRHVFSMSKANDREQALIAPLLGI